MAAAFVALICDFLKGNNEMLREMNLELRVRREEEQKRIQLLAPRAAEVPYSPLIVLPEEAAEEGEAKDEASVVVLSDEELARVQPLRRRSAHRDRS